MDIIEAIRKYPQVVVAPPLISFAASAGVCAIVWAAARVNERRLRRFQWLLPLRGKYLVILITVPSVLSWVWAAWRFLGFVTDYRR